MSAPRPRVLDVSGLPDVVFGPKNLTWWATLGFMVIEGATLAVCAVTYLYLRQNFPSWPPPKTPLPELLAPTLSVILLLVIMAPMAYASRAAKRRDLRGAQRGVLLGALLSVGAVALRAWEFEALAVRWDHNAYASAIWATLGFHTTLLAVDLVETAMIALLLFRGPLEEKHLADVEDAALYQYFLSLSYVPLYVLIFLVPRWI